MTIDSNYHIHLALCRHAEGTVDEYARLAVQKGYREIGFSDHGPLTQELTKKLIARRMSIDEYYSIYLPEIRQAQLNYPQISILAGLEIEYFSEMAAAYKKMASELDYLILGQHFIKLPKGSYFGVYGPMHKERMLIYANTIKTALETRCFRILAHPELYLFNLRTWDEGAISAAKIIIAAAKENNVLLEINANGIRKSPPFVNEAQEQVYLYPRLEFWRLVKEMDCPAIINDDCHSLNSFGDDATKEAYEFAEKLGINYRTRL